MAVIDRHFVIIGMPRSGTTWLHQRLRQHNKMVCALGRVKEVHYFDRVYTEGIVNPNRSNQNEPTYQKMRFKSYEARAAQIEKELPDAEGQRKDRLQAERDALRRFIDHFGESLEWYAQLFEPRPGDWCLDSTPTYFRLEEEGIRRMISVGGAKPVRTAAAQSIRACRFWDSTPRSCK